MRRHSIDLEQASGPDAWAYIGEFTHRTMNEYAVLVAMLRRAASGITDQAARDALAAMEVRLSAAASAHRALCPPRDDASPRQFDDQLQTLCEALSVSLLGGRDVSLSLFCEPVAVDAASSWRASLIVYELIMNAAKHAFVGEEGGAIVIDMRAEYGEVRCTVSDNGGRAAAHAPGLGSALIDMMAAHLHGRILRSHSAAGSHVALCFPQHPPRRF